MLAAVLPNPKGWDPTKPGRTLRCRQRRILQRERNANFPEPRIRLRLTRLTGRFRQQGCVTAAAEHRVAQSICL